MTFEELKELWEKAGAQQVRPLINTPDKRAWFQACHQWLHSGLTRRDIASDWPAQLFPEDPRRRWVAELHLRLARAIAEHHWPSRSVPPDEVLRQMLDGQQPGVALVTLGEVRDLAVELCAAPPDGSAVVACEHLAGRQWNYRLRPVELDADGRPRSVTVRFLLEYPGGGTVAHLTLELVRGGAGNFHPATPLLFLDFKPDFRWALELARQWAAARGNGWPSKHDIRWRVSLPVERMTGEPHAGLRLPWASEMEGASGGLACGLGLAALLGRTDVERRWLAPELGEVAATGALLDATGRLNGVGAVNLEQKLGPAFAVAVERRLIRVLLYHESNDADVPGKWKAPGSAPQAVPVATLDEALGKLGEIFGPRAAVRRDQAQRHGLITFLGGRTLTMAQGYQQLTLARKLSAAELEQKRREAEDRRRAEAERSGESTGPTARITDAEVSPYEPVALPLAELCETNAAHPGTLGRILIGDPGGGKTTAGKHLTWLAASGKGRAALRTRVPVFIRLREWGADEGVRPLEKYLAHPGWDSVPSDWPRDVECWQRLLDKGDLFLVLDGLDECPPTLLGKLPALVNEWAARMPVLLTCREKNFAAHVDAFPQLPVFRLEPFGTEQRNAFIPETSLTEERQTALIAHLDRTPAVNELALRPFLLDALCLVAGGSGELPETRCSLLDATVNLLLDPARSREAAPAVWPDNEPPEPWQLRRVIARVAWTLNTSQPGRNRFSEEEFGLALKAACRAEELETEQRWQKAYKKFFTHHARLVVPGGAASYFAHNLLMEFLCAVRLHLAVQNPERPKEEDGWDRPIAEDEPLSPRRFVRVRSYERGWIGVMPFVAGLLVNPEPFFRALAPKECGEKWEWPGGAIYRFLRTLPRHATGEDFPDDFHRTRLTVAVQGMGEVPLARLGEHEEFFRSFAELAFGGWFLNRETRESISSLEPIGRVSFRHQGQPWHQSLLDGLVGDDNFEVQISAEAFGAMGSSVARQSGIGEALIRCLRGANQKERARVAWALRTMHRSVAGLPGVVEALADCLSLWQEGEYAHTYALKSLGEMDSLVAGKPEIIDALLMCMHAGPHHVRESVAEAFGNLGSAIVGHPRVYAALVGCLADDQSDCASNALGKLGNSVVAQSGFVEALVSALSNGEVRVRQIAVKACVALWDSVVSQPGVVEALADCLRDPSMHPRAVWALQRVGLKGVGRTVAGRLGIGEAIVRCLRDERASVHSLTLGSLNAWGEAVADESATVEAMVNCLRDESKSVRSSATGALAEMGRALASKPGVPEALMDCLQDSEPKVRAGAVLALGKLGDSLLARHEIREALARCLNDETEDVRSSAIQALKILGWGVASQPEIVDHLVQRLHDTEPHVRQAATELFGTFGGAALERSEVLQALILCLRDHNLDVRKSTAEALVELGNSIGSKPTLVSALVNILGDEDASVRLNAMTALGACGVTGCALLELTLAACLRDEAISMIWGRRLRCVLRSLNAGLPRVYRAILGWLRRHLRDIDAEALRADGVHVWQDDNGIPRLITPIRR